MVVTPLSCVVPRLIVRLRYYILDHRIPGLRPPGAQRGDRDPFRAEVEEIPRISQHPPDAHEVTVYALYDASGLSWHHQFPLSQVGRPFLQLELEVKVHVFVVHEVSDQFL